MQTSEKATITVKASIHAPLKTVWQNWTEPRHITQWCQASDDWHAPHAENDFRLNGRFKTTMAAKDGSVSFDFEGTYTKVQQYESIEYTIDDGRLVKILFSADGDQTRVVETFEPETINSLELQQGGWQAILDNFKKYTEQNI